MKILHVGAKNYPPAHGGVEKVVFDLSEGLSHWVHYFFVEWEQSESGLVRVLRGGLCSQVGGILSLIRREGVSVAHFHKETFIPHALLVSLFFRGTLVTIHGCAWRIKRWPLAVRLVLYMLDLVGCALLPRVVFVSQADHRYFSRIIFWRTLYYVPNGVQKARYSASGPRDSFVYLGRLSPEKNILRLIRMFQGRRERLTLYGPFDQHRPSYREEILHALEEVSGASYGGVVPEADILVTLARYGGFVSVSLSEGMPVAVLEAASVGLRLVLSDISQHRDLGFPDVSYVDPLAPSLEGASGGYSAENRRHVETRFSIGATVDMYRSLYESTSEK